MSTWVSLPPTNTFFNVYDNCFATCVETDTYAVNEQRHKKRLGELRRQLRTLEQEQLKLEAKGIQLERQLRTKVTQHFVNNMKLDSAQYMFSDSSSQ